MHRVCFDGARTSHRSNPLASDLIRSGNPQLWVEVAESIHPQLAAASPHTQNPRKCDSSVHTLLYICHAFSILEQPFTTRCFVSQKIYWHSVMDMDTSSKVSAVPWVSFSDIILITITVIQQSAGYCSGFLISLLRLQMRTPDCVSHSGVSVHQWCFSCFANSDSFSQTGPKTVGFTSYINTKFGLIFLFL